MASKLPGGPLRLHPPFPSFRPLVGYKLPEHEEMAVSRNFTPKSEKLTLFIPVCTSLRLHRNYVCNLSLFLN